jgi:hypothetical protein
VQPGVGEFDPQFPLVPDAPAQLAQLFLHAADLARVHVFQTRGRSLGPVLDRAHHNARNPFRGLFTLAARVHALLALGGLERHVAGGAQGFLLVVQLILHRGRLRLLLGVAKLVIAPVGRHPACRKLIGSID